MLQAQFYRAAVKEHEAKVALEFGNSSEPEAAQVQLPNSNPHPRAANLLRLLAAAWCSHHTSDPKPKALHPATRLETKLKQQSPATASHPPSPQPATVESPAGSEILGGGWRWHPSTLNPQPSKLNPKPLNFNPQP